MAEGVTLPPGAPSVLMVANYRPDVGFAWWLMESFWIDLAQLAAARGMRALLAYPETGPVPAHIQMAPIQTIFQDFSDTSPSTVREAMQLVKQHNIKLVYFTDRGFTSPWYAALRLAGVRAIVTHDHTPGDRPDVTGLRGLLKAAWHHLPAINADLQLVVSPLIGRRAMRNARIPASRIAVVQNGIDPIECQGDRSYVRREFSLPPQAVVCITVSRAAPYKRIDFVISVAERVVQHHARTDVHFVFCGDGPDMQRLRQLVARAHLEPHFVFAGRRRDVPALLCSSDVAIHPSQGEAFSLAVVEYMSAGLPLIVPDIPTVCQAVDHDSTGLVYGDGDVVAAADLICELASNEDRRLSIGARASAKVRSCFSSDMMHRQFIEYMAQALLRAS